MPAAIIGRRRFHRPADPGLSRPLRGFSVVAPLTLVLLSLLFLVSCGERAAQQRPGADDGWPLGSTVDTVLAYAAAPTAAADLPELLDRALAWRPAGLAGDRPTVLAVLDESVMGGLLALALPVADEGALVASLKQSPSVSFQDEKRFVLTVPPESELIRVLRVGRALMTAGSVMERMASFARPVSRSSTWEFTVRDGYALIVPSFEAAFVVGELLQQLPLEGGRDSTKMVLSVDLERVELTYYEELREFRRQLDALLSGDPTAGVAGVLGKMISDVDSDGPPWGDLPLDGATLAALLQMSSQDVLGALQLQLDGLADVDPGAYETRLTLRLRWTEPSPLSGLLDSLRPSPELVATRGEDAQLASFSADPARFSRAFTHWIRPLIEALRGTGPPTDAALDALTELLDPWGGLLLLDLGQGHPLLLVTTQPDQRFDGKALVEWFRPLIAALSDADDGARVGSPAEVPDDDRGEAEQPVDDDPGGGEEASADVAASDPFAGLGSLSRDDMVVLFRGKPQPLRVEALLRQARTLRALDTPAKGPALRLESGDGQLSLGVDDGVLQIVASFLSADGESR